MQGPGIPPVRLQLSAEGIFINHYLKTFKMRSTIIMLALMGTILLTWVLIASIGYLCSESLTFRESATHGATLMFMFIFGWIPCVVVGSDLDKKLAD
jgi:hypothetical protein